MSYLVLYYWFWIFSWLFPQTREVYGFFKKGGNWRFLLFSLLLLGPALFAVLGLELESGLRLNHAVYLVITVVFTLFLRPLRYSAAGIFADFLFVFLLGIVFTGDFSFQSPSLIMAGMEFRIDWLVAGPILLFLFWYYDVPRLPHTFRHASVTHYLSVAMMVISLMFVFSVLFGILGVKAWENIGISWRLILYLAFQSFLIEAYFRLALQKVLRNFFESAFWFIPVAIASIGFGVTIYMHGGSFGYSFMMSILGAFSGYFLFLSRAFYASWLLYFTYLFFQNLFFFQLG